MRSDQRVFITGAGGFIGGRVTEVLHCSGLATVRAGVRRWASAARIGRLPIEIQQCDVTDRDQVREALKDSRFVIHCARGTPDVTIEGTRNVLEAALQAGAERVVHLSTIAVYGDVCGKVDETYPCQYTGNPYGDSKIKAEEICWEFQQQGLPICILRPTIVYGPFNRLWTIEFAQRMQDGPWLLPARYCQGICNLVYVDDVVSAIILALKRKEAVGEAFNVNGVETVTWNDYFHTLSTAMGLPELTPASAARSHLSALLMAPVRSSAKFLLREFNDQIMVMYKRYDLVKAVMRRSENVIKKRPTPAEFKLYSKDAFYVTSKASRLLEYKPMFSMNEGVALSVAWLRHHGFVTNG